jgi:hypothetical protein
MSILVVQHQAFFIIIDIFFFPSPWFLCLSFPHHIWKGKECRWAIWINVVTWIRLGWLMTRESARLNYSAKTLFFCLSFPHHIWKGKECQWAIWINVFTWIRLGWLMTWESARLNYSAKTFFRLAKRTQNMVNFVHNKYTNDISNPYKL